MSKPKFTPGPWKVEKPDGAEGMVRCCRIP